MRHPRRGAGARPAHQAAAHPGHARRGAEAVPEAGEVCADTCVPEPACCTYGLRVPASCVLYVPEAQGSSPRGATHCTRASLGVPHVPRTVAPRTVAPQAMLHHPDRRRAHALPGPARTHTCRTRCTHRPTASAIHPLTASAILPDCTPARSCCGSSDPGATAKFQSVGEVRELSVGSQMSLGARLRVVGL